QNVEQSSAFMSSSKILRSPILQAARTAARKEANAEKETPKRTRDPSSPSEPQRATPAQKTRASSERSCAGMLTELEGILEDIILQTHEKQVRRINLKIKRMFCRMKELQEGLSGALICQIDESHPGSISEAICSRCGQQDVPMADKQ
ncbi:hypothetical protein KR067_006649, partial [Drosophila pandora]